MTTRHTRWTSKQKPARRRYLGVITCECGKATYTSRKNARAAARSIRPGDRGLSAYVCRREGSENDDPERWHFGHAPKRDGYYFDRHTGLLIPLPTDQEGQTDA